LDTSGLDERAKQAGSFLKNELQNRTRAFSAELQGTARQLRDSSDDLNSKGNVASAMTVRVVADRVDDLSTFFAAGDVDRMLADLERAVRRAPVTTAAGTFVAGFALSRLLKASARRGYVGGRVYYYREEFEEPENGIGR
jgi:hypothetical protein